MGVAPPYCRMPEKEAHEAGSRGGLAPQGQSLRRCRSAQVVMAQALFQLSGPPEVPTGILRGRASADLLGHAPPVDFSRAARMDSLLMPSQISPPPDPGPGTGTGPLKSASCRGPVRKASCCGRPAAVVRTSPRRRVKRNRPPGIGVRACSQPTSPANLRPRRGAVHHSSAASGAFKPGCADVVGSAGGRGRYPRLHCRHHLALRVAARRWVHARWRFCVPVRPASVTWTAPVSRRVPSPQTAGDGLVEQRRLSPCSAAVPALGVVLSESP